MATTARMPSRLYLAPGRPRRAADRRGAPARCCRSAPRCEIDADELKQRRQLMTPDEYQKEFERLMIALAAVSRDIRRRQKT